MIKKQCVKCKNEFEVDEKEGYKQYCSIACYKNKEQSVRDPYEQDGDEDKLSPVEFGQVLNLAAKKSFGGVETNIEKNFNELKIIFLKLKKENQR